MTDGTPPLAVTCGDPAGIGLEIALMAWARARAGVIAPLPTFFLLTDPDHLSTRCSQLNLQLDIDALSGNQALSSADGLPVMPLANRLCSGPAQPADEDAAGIVEAIDRAVDLIRQGSACGMVTLPINKKSLYDSGFDYPGHTEYLGALATHWENAEAEIFPVMMLAGPDVRAVPVTIHIPLKDVPASLTKEAIIRTSRIVAADLKRRFGIDAPRLAISGLNPHAGEGGALGAEDATVIAPAVSILQDEGIHCFGPLPADTMFHAAARTSYDAAICMYHDQALIPAKALAFDETVNVTLGLPFIRTSPDHGTAFDIAGTGQANIASFVAALRMAAEMADRQN